MDRARRAARAQRVLNVLVFILGALFAVATQGTFDDFKRVYLSDVSPAKLMVVEILVQVVMGWVIWRTYGGLSMEDDTRAENELLHQEVAQVLEQNMYLVQAMERLTSQQCQLVEMMARMCPTG